jgi:cyclic beta-1,2-glucan synthetase
MLTVGPETGDGGLRFFIRDMKSGEFWAAGQPTGQVATRSTPGVFQLDHTQKELKVSLETCVLSDRSAELRRLTLTDLSRTDRQIEVTSLAEVVLNHQAAHAAHPAFSKLFLQTEFVAAHRALLIHRRPRDPEEHTPTLVHAMLDAGPLEWETDRALFFGRGYHRDRPAAMQSRAPLSGTVGNVLDPVACLRRQVSIPAGGRVTLTFLLGVGSQTDEALKLAAGLNTDADIEGAFEQARRTGDERLNRLESSVEDHIYAQHLAAAILRGDRCLRPSTLPPLAPGNTPSDLKALDIDPHQPVVVVRASAPALQYVLKLQRIWMDLGLSFQLVVVDDGAAQPGSISGVVRIQEGDLTRAQWDLLSVHARLVITGSLPELGQLVPQVSTPCAALPRPAPTWPHQAESELTFFNGRGGFSSDGREYVINLPSDSHGRLDLPPRPWTNVLANEKLGGIVSETGAGATWGGNSREHRLTPWSNDPVLDPSAEALYLRDESDGHYFSILPGPVPAGGHYEVRHGHGYSQFQRQGDGLAIEALMFVHHEDPVRFQRIRLRNTTSQTRRFSLLAYTQLVLGDTPENSERYVVTSHDPASGALLARNPVAGPFASHITFSLISGDAPLADLQFSGDRREVLGVDQDPTSPAALRGKGLQGRVGAGLAPCFAFQGAVELAPEETAEIWVLLGQAEHEKELGVLLARYARPAGCAEAWQTTREFWRQGLDGLQISTPSQALDLMVNGWLGYQTLACRMMGRSAFYQSGGAYGFRDQLQDSLSLLPIWPELTRAQILRHAAHQFVEGDVLHWWHPPLSQGIRTRFADDLLWLPLATVEYLKATGDREILAQVTPFLKARQLEPGQDEVFLQPEPSGESADLYEHCCRALDRSLTLGRHGLPLFGTGDWNDGMNRVGRQGLGESVWMGFFLVTIIDGFLPLCEECQDHERAARYRRYRNDMVHTLNDAGWDGGWYRRGYYDDGSPLGSWENKECAIDALAQSWSVLSGVASPARADQVMDAVEEHLINDDERLIRLLTPPFVDTPHDPGYIKGYVAGVRENGGQYTHAALWVVKAMATLGRRPRAAALLELLNPINHALTPAQVDRYQVEPYVVAADVYGAAPHVGRGGWTWYTGSSGWMHRVALESVLGFRPEGRTLVVAPCVPDDWPEYTINWRVPGGSGTRYRVKVVNPEGCAAVVRSCTLDGNDIAAVDGTARIPLLKDGNAHQVIITLGTLQGECE